MTTTQQRKIHTNWWTTEYAAVMIYTVQYKRTQKRGAPSIFPTGPVYMLMTSSKHRAPFGAVVSIISALISCRLVHIRQRQGQAGLRLSNWVIQGQYGLQSSSSFKLRPYADENFSPNLSGTRKKHLPLPGGSFVCTGVLWTFFGHPEEAGVI